MNASSGPLDPNPKHVSTSYVEPAEPGDAVIDEAIRASEQWVLEYSKITPRW